MTMKLTLSLTIILPICYQNNGHQYLNLLAASSFLPGYSLDSRVQNWIIYKSMSGAKQTG